MKALRAPTWNFHKRWKMKYQYRLLKVFQESIKGEIFTNLLISEFAVIAESESVPSPIPTGLLQSDGEIEAYIDLIRRMNIRFFVKC